MWDVDLLSSTASSHDAIARSIERLTREMARIIGVESLLLGEKGAGSLALSRDKTAQFSLLVDGSLKELSESFKNDLVSIIFDLNGWDKKLMPTLKTEAIRYRDVNDITQSLTDLAQAGAPLNPQDDAVGEVFDIMGLTRPNVDLMQAEIDASIQVSSEPESPEEGNTDGLGGDEE